MPILLAEAAFRHNIKLVHVSSGCIYHYDYKQQKPIQENCVPDYYDLFYSRTKSYAESVLMQLAERKGLNVLIARIRVPLDHQPHPKNLLTKLIKYQKVIDLPNSVTYVPDFIKAMKHLIRKDSRGIYNIVNKGGLYYPDLLNAYRKHHPEYHFEIIRLKSLGLNRTSLLMSVNKLEKTGFKVRPIRKVLEECVSEYIKF